MSEVRANLFLYRPLEVHFLQAGARAPTGALQSWRLQFFPGDVQMTVVRHRVPHAQSLPLDYIVSVTAHATNRTETSLGIGWVAWNACSVTLLLSHTSCASA